MKLTDVAAIIDLYGPDKILVAYRPQGHPQDIEIGVLRSTADPGVFVLYRDTGTAKLTDPADLTAFDPDLRYEPDRCPLCYEPVAGVLTVEPEDSIHPLGFLASDDAVTSVQRRQLKLVPCLHPIDQIFMFKPGTQPTKEP